MLTQEMVADVPSDPGVYFFRGVTGTILYIGKAKCLRKRVRSYLHKVKKRPTKIKRLIRWTTDVRYQVCRSEQEALFLESRLIQEHQPSYNTAMKFGRQSWYIRIDVGEAFPQLERVSETQPDGARYFGPLSSRRWTDEAVDVLQRIFPVRTCEGEITPTPGFRACFQYDLKRCNAPCAALITSKLYKETITDVVNLLDGEYEKCRRVWFQNGIMRQGNCNLNVPLHFTSSSNGFRKFLPSLMYIGGDRMTTEKTTKEVLGGPNRTARCRCGRLRYPRYKLCPKCYYEGRQASPDLKKLSRADLLKMQAAKPMPLSDRQERIQFLEKRYGAQFRGQDIRFMKNSQIYALSEQAGYRRR